jgi:CubicO group peptidase (beta-lactamase class C family)
MESLHGTVMVTRAGSTLTALAGGLADVEAGLPCTSETRFQLCSVSKQFTAAAAMLLVESGDLDLSEPVERWLPGAPSQWGQVTLHHILSNTAGIPHFREAPGLDPAEPMPIGQRLEVIQATPLRTEPAAQWHYSSPGFLLAGAIVERAAGVPYQQFVTERILAPLRLTQTTLGASPDNAAHGYHGGRPVAPFDLGTMPGCGDIWSTAADLTRFITALYGGALLRATSLHAMCTAHARIEDDDEGEPRLITTGYGYATYTGVFGGHPALFHNGDNPGFLSLACWIPDRDASIVILVNDEAVSITSLLRQLLHATLEPRQGPAGER